MAFLLDTDVSERSVSGRCRRHHSNNIFFVERNLSVEETIAFERCISLRRACLQQGGNKLENTNTCMVDILYSLLKSTCFSTLAAAPRAFVFRGRNTPRLPLGHTTALG